MSIDAKTLLAEAETLRPALLTDRRTLHRNPEAGPVLPHTAAYVKQRLTELGLCAPRHGRRRHGGHHRNGYWPLRAAADRHGCAADSGGHRTGISVRKRRHARLRP